MPTPGHVMSDAEIEAILAMEQGRDDTPRHIATLATIYGRLAAANAKLAEAHKSLRGFVTEEADDPCRYDHHGLCQSHGLQPKGECYMELARIVLGMASPAPSGDAKREDGKQ